MTPTGTTSLDAIDRLLMECLDAPSDTWRARIQAASAAQPAIAVELRARFERLLALRLLDAPERDGKDGSLVRLGPYRIVRRVGGGGMGVVYEAHDERLGRRVALKVVHSELLLVAKARERFEREMRAASRIDHPHLCPVYEAGEIDGLPYIAMRYIEGESLAEQLQHRREAKPATRGGSSAATLPQLVHLVEKVARALHAAHEAGLVHRDVKPANILIDGEGEPVLIDFGLAREAESAQLTQTGERLGTPAYMAPEQVSGEAPVDGRADVYGLGATLYEGLTLHAPFDAVTGREAVYHHVLHQPPRDPRRFDRSIGVDLAVVVGKALEKRPEKRFTTAEEFADELQRIRTHRPIRSRRPGTLLRLLRWAQRNRAATGILAATAVGLLVSLLLLRESRVSERRFRALAWLQAAGVVERRDPELAFKCGREALRLHDDPVILAKVQETMFGMRSSVEVVRMPEGIHRLAFSPEGRFLLVRGRGVHPSLYREEGGAWHAVALPDTGFRRGPADFPAFAYSPDGDELALGTADGSIHRYDLAAREPRALDVLRLDLDATGADPVCWRLEYSPDGERLLACHETRTVVWERTGHMLRVLEGDHWYVSACLAGGRVAANGWLWSESGERLVPLRTEGRPVFALQAESKLLLVTARWFEGPVRQIHAFSSEGRRLEIAADFEDAPQAGDDIVGAEVAPGGERLLVARRDGQIKVLETATLGMLHAWRLGHGHAGAQARFSPDGRWIASGYETLQIRRADDGHLVDEIRGLQGHVTCLDWSKDGERLAVATSSGAASVWKVEAFAGVPAFVGQGAPDLDVSPSGERVAFTSNGEAVLLCDGDGRLLERRVVPSGVSHVTSTSEEQFVLVREGARDFHVWSRSESGKDDSFRTEVSPRWLGGHPPVPVDGDRWLLWGDRMISFWRPRDGAREWPLREAIIDFAVDPNRLRLLTGGPPAVQIRALDGGHVWRSAEEVGGGFVGFATDGHHVFAAAVDTNAYLWDVRREPAVAEVFRGHQNGLNGAALSIDGTRFATSSHDGSIRVWDRTSRRTLLRFRHDGVTGIAFTASGRLVSAGEDGTVRWWWLRTGQLRRAVEALDVPELTRAERDRLGHLIDGSR